MKFWEDIVNKATLGSAKLGLKASDIPEAITREFNLRESNDKEEDFLRISSFAYQIRQAGSRPLNCNNTRQTESEEESNQYCSGKSNASLNTILADEHYPLLLLWLKLCATSEQIAAPEMIPVLLDIALRKKELRKYIIAVCGKRGEWLSKLNPRWDFFPSATNDDTWETGKLEERKDILRDLRGQNPTEALELLRTTWASEGANEKVAFLDILKTNLSFKDLPWLESLNEKGQKVKAAIQDLLKLIPSSAIIREYTGHLENAISIRSGKALLGMRNKTTIEIDESLTVPESIFKAGIDRLSSNKKVTDSQYVLWQLISEVPPSFWNEHLQRSSEEIVQLLQKEKQTVFYLSALAKASVKFSDKDWIKNILDHGDVNIINDSIISLIGALSGEDRDYHALQFIKEKPGEIIQLMVASDCEWSHQLAKAILRHTAKEVYIYNRNFYRPAAALIPVSVGEILNSFTPAEDQKKVYWKNQSDELSRLLTMKKQIIQSFTI